MELERLIEALNDPAAYSYPVEVVEVRQTHISVVFLAGPYAYKVKKPLDLGFLDYSTLEKRRAFCEQEVLLNRRLAAGVYLGVVPVSQEGTAVTMGGPGETIEWAVMMKRLPDEATLRERLRREEVESAQVEALAERIVTFHAGAEAGRHISAGARFEVVARNARENFEQSAAHVGRTVARGVFERLWWLTEVALAWHRPVIAGRAARGVPRDTHGDLRLDHVYLFPGQSPPDDLVIVDCIEFDERFRYADPVADIAFLVMDFARHGRRDLSRVCADAYFRATGDVEGRSLLSFYVAYRAAVRGKVEGMKHTESEVPAADRAAALDQARAYWLLALGELEVPGRRPCLVVVGGLPGTGKSTLARGLAEDAGFQVIRSDLVRKVLAGLAAGAAAPADFGQGIYSREWDERTYDACAEQTAALLFEGKRVLVDARFSREAQRRQFLELATRWGVPVIFLLCRAEPAVVRTRLDNRRHDASDADWSIYQQAAARWEAPSPTTERATRTIEAGGESEHALSQAVAALTDWGLRGSSQYR